MDRPSNTDSPHWAERPFQRQLYYVRTSQSHRIEHQDNEEQKHNEKQKPISWWFPLDDTEQETEPQERGRSVSDNVPEDGRSRSRVSFSSMDNVKVFFPDLPDIKLPSHNPRPKKLTVEDNILRIGETSMYRGRLDKRVDVLSRISEVSSRSSPVVTPQSPIIQATDRDIDDNRKKISIIPQITDRTTDPLPSLKRVPHQLKDLADGMERQETKPLCHATLTPSSYGVDTQRERIQQLLSTKPRRSNLKETSYSVLPNIGSNSSKARTTKSNARGTKLPAIGRSNACVQEKARGQGEDGSSLSLSSYLPKPPTCQRKDQTFHRRYYN